MSCSLPASVAPFLPSAPYLELVFAGPQREAKAQRLVNRGPNRLKKEE